jgi:transcription elongation factor GreA
MIEELRAKLMAEAEALNYELQVTLPDALEKALEHGDLRENADYQAAIERQGVAAARLEHVRSRLHKLSDIDLTELPNDRVALGSKLTVVDVETGEREDYEVVIPDAVDVMDGCISVSSPLGRAFMDRQENDVVTVRLPIGMRELRIEKLLTLHDQAQEQHDE